MQVRDQSGFEYTLNKGLGQGGQGMVWTTNTNGVAIKTLMRNDDFVRDPNLIQEYKARIDNITKLPLFGLNQFSLPVAILQDVCGYVMRFMKGTAPLFNFMPHRFTSKSLQEAHVDLPDWLKTQLDSIVEQAQSEAELKQSAALEESLKRLALYALSGGARVRLHILYEMADILSKLHERGLVFGDLSVNNVLVSSLRYLTWFIDIDNLCLQGNGSMVYTPGCCAPEVYSQQAGVSQQSDAYAFAILVCELLTMRHPFLSGRLVEESGDMYETQEDLANRGQIPWFLDAVERDNALGHADELVPYTLTHGILSILQQTFGVGRLEPMLRPPLWMFKHVLKQAFQHFIVCPHCMMGFSYGENQIVDGKCPFCGEPLPWILTVSFSRKVLWVHELVNLDLSGQPYSKFPHINRLALTLDLLDPDAGHRPYVNVDQASAKMEQKSQSTFSQATSTQATKASFVDHASPNAQASQTQSSNAALASHTATAHAAQPMSGMAGKHEVFVGIGLGNKDNRGQQINTQPKPSHTVGVAQARGGASNGTLPDGALAGLENIKNPFGSAFSNTMQRMFYSSMTGAQQGSAEQLAEQSAGQGAMDEAGARAQDVALDFSSLSVFDTQPSALSASGGDYLELLTAAKVKDEGGVAQDNVDADSVDSAEGSEAEAVESVDEAEGAKNVEPTEVAEPESVESYSVEASKEYGWCKTESANVQADISAESVKQVDLSVSSEAERIVQQTLEHIQQPLQEQLATMGNANTIVASLAWLNDALSFYPEASFQGKLEYFLIPANIREILRDPAKRAAIKPRFTRCPNGFSFTLEQLQQGVSLRLAGKRQVLLQVVRA